MKKILFITAIAAIILSGCNVNNDGDKKSNLTSSDSEPSVTSVTSSEPITEVENINELTETINSEIISQKPETSSQNFLPENVAINILGNDLSNDNLTEISFSESGVWGIAKYEGFAYMAEPSKSDFKRYNIGDTICGLTLTSAQNIFGNDYLDNEYHEKYRCTSIANLEGTLTMTGTLTIMGDDDANFLIKKGDILFYPEEDVFPIINGLPDNQYYYVLCGNINDNVIPELLQLPIDEEINVKINVSDIMLYSAMPVDAYVQCKIDNIDLL